jgi:hypothetical protein
MSAGSRFTPCQYVFTHYSESAFNNGKTFIREVDEFIGKYRMDPLRRHAMPPEVMQRVAHLMPGTMEETIAFLDGMDEEVGQENERYHFGDWDDLYWALVFCKDVPDLLHDELLAKIAGLSPEDSVNYVYGLKLLLGMQRVSQVLHAMFVGQPSHFCTKLARWTPKQRAALDGLLSRLEQKLREISHPGR